MPAADRYGNLNDIDTAARRFAVITTSDAEQTEVPKALYFNSAGAVSLVAADDFSNAGAGTPVIFQVDARQLLLVRPRIVRTTGTTVVANDIIGLY